MNSISFSRLFIRGRGVLVLCVLMGEGTNYVHWFDQTSATHLLTLGDIFLPCISSSSALATASVSEYDDASEIKLWGRPCVGARPVTLEPDTLLWISLSMFSSSWAAFSSRRSRSLSSSLLFTTAWEQKKKFTIRKITNNNFLFLIQSFFFRHF